MKGKVSRGEYVEDPYERKGKVSRGGDVEDPMREQIEDPGRRGRGSNERTGRGSRGGEVVDPMREQAGDSMREQEGDSMRRQAEDLGKDRKKIPGMTGKRTNRGFSRGQVEHPRGGQEGNGNAECGGRDGSKCIPFASPNTPDASPPPSPPYQIYI
jgi:hypothetical protein